MVTAGKIDIAGVVDATQIAEVLQQWHENETESGIPSSKSPLLRTVLTRAPFSGKVTTPYAPGSVHDYMHAKVTVADDTVFLGSFNLSHSGEMNAENVLEIADAGIAEQLRRVHRFRARALSGGRRCPSLRSARRRRLRDPRDAAPERAELRDLPRGQPVEHAGRHAAGREELRGDDQGDRPRRAAFMPTSAPGTWDGGPIGIPFDVVSNATPTSRVRFDYADESDKVRYPIPKNVHIEGGPRSTGDRHALLVDKSTCRLYELYNLHHTSRGWTAGSGATWSLSLRQAPACGLDVGRRRRAADLPRPRALGRGVARA